MRDLTVQEVTGVQGGLSHGVSLVLANVETYATLGILFNVLTKPLGNTADVVIQGLLYGAAVGGAYGIFSLTKTAILNHPHHPHVVQVP